MFVEMKTIQVKEGFSEQVVNRFSGEGPIEKAEGFIDLSVMVKKTRKGDEEVLVLVRWESEEAWKNWEKSEPHLEMHRQSREQGKPDFIIGGTHGLYELRGTKTYSAGS